MRPERESTYYFVNKYVEVNKNRTTKQRKNRKSKPIHALHRRLIFIGFCAPFHSTHLVECCVLSLFVVQFQEQMKIIIYWIFWLSEKRSFPTLYYGYHAVCTMVRCAPNLSLIYSLSPLSLALMLLSLLSRQHLYIYTH